MREKYMINSELNHTSRIFQKPVTESKKVDINVLLKKVSAEQKKEKFENTIFFAMVAAVIVVTGIIVSL